MVQGNFLHKEFTENGIIQNFEYFFFVKFTVIYREYTFYLSVVNKCQYNHQKFSDSKTPFPRGKA